MKISESFTNSHGNVAVQIFAGFLVIAMTATTFLTQRQLMSKNMPADALSGPYAQQQKMLLYVLPVVFAVGGIAFPIGVLLYWTTSNLWTMGQQFYVIRNNPAPNTEAFRAKQARDEAKRQRKHGPRGHPGRPTPRLRRRRPSRSSASSRRSSPARSARSPAGPQSPPTAQAARRQASSGGPSDTPTDDPTNDPQSDQGEDK